jgi:hypothetical protein
VAITGFIEFAGTERVIGWAFDSESPAVHLEVTVRVGNEFCASGFADVQRNDLHAAGIGDGAHGFAIDLREADITAEDVAALEVHAISGAEIIKLSRIQRASADIIDLLSDPLGPTSDESQFPVFVLGSARSGTSAITLALLESRAYVGSGEGHLMPLANMLLTTIDQHYRHVGYDPNTTLGRVSIDAFQRLVRRSFVQLARDLFQATRWLDKTPTVEMVRAAPLMKEIWPNAKFIFMKRRAIENVLSRQRKFPADAVDRHYSDWVAVMTAWLEVREQLGDSVLEVEHRQLVLNPQTEASSIANFLELPEASAASFVSYICEMRPERTDPNFGATYEFDDLGLDEQDARKMRAACDPIMKAMGYSYDESYFGSADL